MIPKIIHYIWLGGEKSSIAKKAIKTWQSQAPEYQIIEWNEKNLPNFTNQFYRDAMINQNFAFASDYARLMILKKYGGVYMDTDMFLLTNPSKLLENKDLVFGIQDKNIIFSAGFIASVPNHEFINQALSIYNRADYYKNTLKANTELLSPLVFKMYGFRHEAKTQLKGRIAAYSPNILLQPSFHAVAMHIGAKAWASHNKHDQLRIKLRQHVKSQFAAGTFRIVNDIFRKII